jgi:putative sigma-54 modulation protein
MNDLPIHIMSHGIELRFALRKFIEKKVSGLSRFAGDILSAEVVLREKSGANGLFSVSARLALPGRDVHGNSVHENFYSAINQLVARLARLSRKRKTRFEKRIRRAGRFQFVKAEADTRSAKTTSRQAQRKHAGTINYEPFALAWPRPSIGGVG